MKRTLSAIVLAIAALSIAVPAHAASFSGGRSSFSSSRSFSSPSYSKSSSYWGTPKPAAPTVPKYTAPAVPKPAPAPVKNVTINRTTVVQQNAVQQSSSGGGFFSSFAGSFAGAGIASWLFAPKPAAQPQQVIDCSKQPLPVEWAQHCPAKQ